jgi:N-acetylglucosaminyldiphosphoundecaprenol N-acetyl-beta-D-mannosaminyltransferase
MRLIDIMQSNVFEHYRVINASIVSTTMKEALSEVERRARGGDGGYVCFVNAHVSVMTRQDEALEAAVNDSTFAFPDGMPVYLVGKLLKGQNNQKISGPDFMGHMFADEKLRTLKHYFYGAQQGILDQLVVQLKSKYPGCNIVGAVSPPFRALTDEEKIHDLAHMRGAGAQVVWVGLGAPKQEFWMHENTALLPNAMLMGVGAAFDFHADVIGRAPDWAQKYGFEWLHRLLQEPRRLWKRYLVTNTLFIWYTIQNQLLSTEKETFK